MYSKIKYKCSITLISLIESRNSDDAVIRMVKSINISILRRNILDIFLNLV